MSLVMYYAFLGHTPALSLLELCELKFDPQAVTDKIAAIKSDQLLPQAGQLGGTVKIAAMLSDCDPDRDKVIATLESLILKDGAKNIALTNFTSVTLSHSDIYQLKSGISRPVRFVSMDTGEHELVMLARQHVSEFNLIPVQNRIVIAKTVWIQDGIEWGKRDRERPYQDIKRGMLPPKLARLLVNLATRGQEGTLLDPFCGTGTILAEAMLTGHSVIGADNDEAALTGSRRNLDWLLARYPSISTSFQLMTADAVHLSKEVKAVDYIATEPYLGPLLDARRLPEEQKIRDIAKGLDKLYRGCLNDWSKLTPRRIVMIIPEFHLGVKVIPTLGVDRIPALGYNILAQVSYSKPGAVVVRKITILEKN